MSNEGEKRKQACDDAVAGSQKKAREATDEEVEKFYAILRRMKAAEKYFKGSGDHGGASQGRWSASLEEQIRQEVKQGEARGLNFDLNASPQPE